MSTKVVVLDCISRIKLFKDIRQLIRYCIHNLSTIEEERIPRPFSLSTHGTSPIAFVHYDHIETGLSETVEKYVVKVRDDHLNYC